MKRFLSIGILILFSAVLLAIQTVFSSPVLVDDDVGYSVELTMDDFDQHISVDGVQTTNETIRLQESRWNYPGASTFSVPTVSSEISYAQTYDFYIIRPAGRNLIDETITIRLCDQHYQVKVNASTTGYHGMEVLGIGKSFMSPDVK